jgi:GNAT superfamily N-acetyltransferase
MSIRSANIDDTETIGELIVGLAEYEELVHEVVWTVPQLRATGAVAGFALWYPTFSTFLGSSGIWLEDLFVKPEFRGGGHGLALLKTLRDRTNGRVEWSVLDWNEPSIRFYESLGAQPVDGWTRYRWLPPQT